MSDVAARLASRDAVGQARMRRGGGVERAQQRGLVFDGRRRKESASAAQA